MATNHLVVDRDRAGNAGKPAALGGTDAEQPDDVRVIGVIGQALAGLIAAHVRLGVVEAEVGDVAEHVVLAVLRNRGAEVQAERPVGPGVVRQGVILDRHPAQQRKAAPMKELVAERREPLAEDGQGYVIAGQIEQVACLCAQ